MKLDFDVKGMIKVLVALSVGIKAVDVFVDYLLSIVM